ncbi:unnamed protein product [Malus baccata var. baccata]
MSMFQKCKHVSASKYLSIQSGSLPRGFVFCPFFLLSFYFIRGSGYLINFRALCFCFFPTPKRQNGLSLSVPSLSLSSSDGLHPILSFGSLRSLSLSPYQFFSLLEFVRVFQSLSEVPIIPHYLFCNKISPFPAAAAATSEPPSFSYESESSSPAAPSPQPSQPLPSHPLSIIIRRRRLWLGRFGTKDW